MLDFWYCILLSTRVHDHYNNLWLCALRHVSKDGFLAIKICFVISNSEFYNIRNGKSKMMFWMLPGELSHFAASCRSLRWQNIVFSFLQRTVSLAQLQFSHLGTMAICETCETWALKCAVLLSCLYLQCVCKLPSLTLKTKFPN